MAGSTAGHAACMRRRLECRLEAGRGEERTSNIQNMSATLEMSKLSGWLNADACCRESKGGHMVRGEGAGLEAGGRRVTAVHAACRGGLGCRLGAGHGEERTLNM